MGVLETTPRATKAAILRSVAGSQHPKIDLPTIAHRYGMTLTDLQAIVHKHGWPRPESMRKAAEVLERAAAEPAASDDGVPTVKVVDLHPDLDNPREDLGDVVELADSLREVGMLQPIVARRSEPCSASLAD